MTELLLKLFVKDYQNTSDTKTRIRIGSFAGTVGVVCNVALCIAKMVIGFFSGAVSVIADAVNNLGDAASNIISLFGFKLASKPPDKNHPYGHGRYEYLSGLIVVVLILVIGVELLKSSIEKIITPEPIEFSVTMVVILVMSILVKLWMVAFNNKLGKLIDSQTLIATAVDSRNDVISTLAVLFALIIGEVAGCNLDGIMGVLVAVFILWSGIGLVRETVDPLLGGAPDPELVKHIQKKALSYKDVLGIHDLLVHDYGPGRCFASLHVEVSADIPVLKSHDIIDQIEEDFRNNDGIEVSIHLDPVVTSDPRVAELREWLSSAIKEEINPALSIHDFRIVPGETRTNLIFDCLLPYSVDINPADLEDAIQKVVSAKYPDYFCVIHVDRDYAAGGYTQETVNSADPS